MKKMILAIVAVAAGMFSANAQNITPRLEVGANFTNFSLKSVSNETSNSDAKIGFRVGGAVEIGLTNILYVAPGVAYQYNSTNVKSNENKSTINQHVVSVPVNLGARFEFANNLAVSVEVGPYAQVGLSGKFKGNDASVDIYSKDKNEYFVAKRFDLGLGGGVAFHYSNYYLGVNAQLGLLNQLAEKNESVEKVTSQGFNVSVGYRF